MYIVQAVTRQTSQPTSRSGRWILVTISTIRNDVKFLPQFLLKFLLLEPLLHHSKLLAVTVQRHTAITDHIMHVKQAVKVELPESTVLCHSSVSVGRCSSPFQGPEPAVSRSSITWAVGQTSPVYCRYLTSDEASSKLYCLVTEAHVCKELAQGCYVAVKWAGVEPGTSRTTMLLLHYQAMPSRKWQTMKKL